jgi:hypothetical protein
MMTYYIDESYVRENLPVDYSLLTGNIKPALNQAHLINARDLMGDPFFDKMNEIINNGQINDPQYADWKYLLDNYLQDVVLYWTGVYLLTNNLAKLSNRGIQLENSEFSNSADLAVWRTLKNEMADLASYYSQRCKDWLYWNQNLFQPFYTYFTNDGRQPANPKDKYRAGGLVIGMRNRWSPNNRCCY